MYYRLFAYQRSRVFVSIYPVLLFPWFFPIQKLNTKDYSHEDSNMYCSVFFHSEFTLDNNSVNWRRMLQLMKSEFKAQFYYTGIHGANQFKSKACICLQQNVLWFTSISLDIKVWTKKIYTLVQNIIFCKDSPERGISHQYTISL